MAGGVIGGLAVRDVHAVRGSVRVLRGVSLNVAPGEICALMGTSGAGKTTMLRAIAALEPFTAGSIKVDDFVLAPGELPPESRLRALRRGVGMVFQAHSLFEHLTALDNVTLALVHALGWTRPRSDAAALALLEELGVANQAAAYPRQLSGGEAQRVTIARALAPDPTMLLLDEPTSALDPARRSGLGEIFRTLASEGCGLLIATHDVDVALAYADRVAILSQGVVVEEGEARDVLSNSPHADTRALLRSAGSGPRG
ncbi:MAG: ATP-binding cassette domain-containing protein [Chloroflexota bacterium]|nr:ATP-binding cassette domain-containing protein [Chloroflexota bacterium]